jgi:hypothetical protein
MDRRGDIHEEAGGFLIAYPDIAMLSFAWLSDGASQGLYGCFADVI